MQYKGTLVAVKDMEIAKEFYGRVLDLKITADFGANVLMGDAVYLQTVDTWQDFIGMKMGQSANDAELYFETEDFSAFITKLNSFADIKYVHPAVEHAWGQHAVRFYDPDGHIIEVAESVVSVVRRFCDAGLSEAETAKRMDVPLDYIEQCLQK